MGGPGGGGGGQGGGSEDQIKPQVFGEDKKADYGPDYTYQRIRFHKKDEINPYAEMQDERYGLDPRTKKILGLLLFTIVVLFIVMIMPTNIFGVGRDASPAQLLKEIRSAAMGVLTLFSGGESQYTTYALTIVVTAFAGAALALSGGVYQGAMKNALASPSTLGVMQGGSLGIIIYIVLFYTGDVWAGKTSEYQAYLDSLSAWEYFGETFGMYLCGLLGCTIVVAIVMALAYIAGHGKVSNVSLVVAGQVFASVASMAIQWIRYYITMTSDDETLIALLEETQSASFEGAYTGAAVLTFVVPLSICMIIIFAMSSKLSLLAFDEDEARSMGISTRATRIGMVAVCTVMTALVVSFCGAIGFVGFMVPHIARRIVGADFRYLLPCCAMVGAMLVSVVYFCTQLGLAYVPSNSTGFYTSIIGCLMFLFMALRQRGSSRGEWI